MTINDRTNVRTEGQIRIGRNQYMYGHEGTRKTVSVGTNIRLLFILIYNFIIDYIIYIDRKKPVSRTAKSLDTATLTFAYKTRLYFVFRIFYKPLDVYTGEPNLYSPTV